MRDPEFHRIRRLPPYVFAEVNRLKADARAAGRDIIDLGMGNPDLPTPGHIVEKLVETVRDGRTHRYSTSRGIPGLRKAWASYYGRRFGVSLDPETQICVTLGLRRPFTPLALEVERDPGIYHAADDHAEQAKDRRRQVSSRLIAVSTFAWQCPQSAAHSRRAILGADKRTAVSLTPTKRVLRNDPSRPTAAVPLLVQSGSSATDGNQQAPFDEFAGKSERRI